MKLPIDRQPTETEARLLDAALEVFASKGLHGATTQEIGKLAGVGKSTLHYYFRHKDELYARVFEEAFRRMAVPLRERIHPGQGLRETLEGLIEYQVRAYHESPAMVHLWIHENLIGAPVAVPMLRRFNARPESPYRLFVDNLRRAIENGEARPVDPLQTFVTVMGACLFLSIARPSMAATLGDFTALGLGPGEARTGSEGEDFDVEDFDMEAFVDARAGHLVDLMDRGLRADGG